MSRDIIELSRGLFKNRGLSKGKSVLHKDKNETILKIFKRDDLYDENGIKNENENEEEKEVGRLFKSAEKKIEQSSSTSSSSSSSSSSSEPKSGPKEKIFYGDDTNLVYQKYKDYFDDEEEFMKLIKSNKKGFYIKESTVKKYLNL